MKIDINTNYKKLASDYPQFKNDLLKIDESIDNFKSKRKNSISLKGYTGINKDGQLLHLYMQYVLHRSLNLLDGICVAWNNETPVISLILCRTLQENIAVAYDMIVKIHNFIDNENFDKIRELIKNRTCGGRDFPEMPKITNFMTAIDKTDKSFKGFKHCYELLSEYSHPNYLGMEYLYGNLDKSKMKFTITHKQGMNETNLQLIIDSIIPCLIILEVTFEEMTISSKILTIK